MAALAGCAGRAVDGHEGRRSTCSVRSGTGRIAADLCERAVDSFLALAWASRSSTRFPLSSRRDEALILSGSPFPDEQIVPFLDQLVLRDEDSLPSSGNELRSGTGDWCRGDSTGEHRGES